MNKIKFQAEGYVKTTRLLPNGGKTVTFEFADNQCIEIARLELMSRNQKTFTPELLKITVELSDDDQNTNQKKNINQTKNKEKPPPRKVDH